MENKIVKRFAISKNGMDYKICQRIKKSSLIRLLIFKWRFMTFFSDTTLKTVEPSQR